MLVPDIIGCVFVVQGFHDRGKTENMDILFSKEEKHKEFTKPLKYAFRQGIYLQCRENFEGGGYLFCTY